MNMTTAHCPGKVYWLYKLYNMLTTGRSELSSAID